MKGKSEAVGVFEVFDGDPPQIKAQKLATLAVFEQGLWLYNQFSFKEAAACFEEVLSINPSDKIAQIYLGLSQI